MRKKIESALLLLLLTSVVYSTIKILSSSTIADYQFYAGVIGLILVTILRIWVPKTSSLILIGILGLGSVNIISFSHITYSFGITLIPWLKLNPIILLLFVISILVNGPSIQKQLSLSDYDEKENNILENAEYQQRELDRFINMYENFSDKELKAITDKSNGYVETARIAAEAILKKRKSSN